MYLRRIHGNRRDCNLRRLYIVIILRAVPGDELEIGLMTHLVRVKKKGAITLTKCMYVLGDRGYRYELSNAIAVRLASQKFIPGVSQDTRCDHRVEVTNA